MTAAPQRSETAIRLFAPAVLAELRSQFPILRERFSGKPLVYLDSAATSQKPQCVIDATSEYYARSNANVHRGLYELAGIATRLYEDSRHAVASLLGAQSAEEIVFVRGVTEAINLVAHSYVKPRLQPGDEILVTLLEHHSNFVPWQILCEETGAKLVIADVDSRGDLDLDDFGAKLSPRTRFASMTHVSNAVGTVCPVEHMIRLAHAQDVPVLVDGAQAAAHQRIDVAALDADFYTISGHKAYGPTGIGALWGRAELLSEMRPYQGGGDMIREVRVDGVDFADPPQRFEAGTPNVAGVVGLGRAIGFMREVGFEAIRAHENALLAELLFALREIPQLRLIGEPHHRASSVSFVIDDIHAQDVATVLDNEGIAVRVGHHCAQPLLDHFGEKATIRASLALFNSMEDVQRLVDGLHKARRILAA